MPALPHSFAPRISPESDAVPQSPNTDQFVKSAASRGDSRGHRVRIVANANRHCSHRRIAVSQTSAASILNPFTCCKFGESSITPFRIIPGKPSPIARIFSLFRRCFLKLFPNHSARPSAGIVCSGSSESPDRPDTAHVGRELVVLDQPHRNVLHHQDAECSCSFPCDRSCHRPRSSLLLHSDPLLDTLTSRQFVEAIERGGLVAFRQRRIIENGVHEIFHRAFQSEHRLPDVKQFGRAFADDVHAEQFLSSRG